ncbi:hypothetical protein ACFQS7_22850 [Dankookia sp. GCM10030260]|uniref:hypothetical protein n=1 Tax=Dankookia sp. GCM10030260 TaxID=3273390 RepID=UPI0036163E6E
MKTAGATRPLSPPLLQPAARPLVAAAARHAARFIAGGNDDAQFRPQAFILVLGIAVPPTLAQTATTPGQQRAEA